MFGTKSRTTAGIVMLGLGTAMFAGCDTLASGSPSAAVSQNAVPGWYHGETPIMRYRYDAARGRVWILNAEGVDLYELQSQRKLAHIELPNWTWVREPHACAPDLALGPQGEAVITSNVVSTVWRIDPGTIAVTQHEIAPDSAPGREFGFTGLEYSARRAAYFGVSSADGSVWQIDPMLKAARDVSAGEPLVTACGVALRLKTADAGRR
jgi:hypothetical protein